MHLYDYFKCYQLIIQIHTSESCKNTVSLKLQSTIAHLDTRYCSVMNYNLAFNTDNPSQLTSKLLEVGLRASLCKWILNLFTGRPPRACQPEILFQPGPHHQHRAMSWGPSCTLCSPTSVRPDTALLSIFCWQHQQELHRWQGGGEAPSRRVSGQLVLPESHIH